MAGMQCNWGRMQRTSCDVQINKGPICSRRENRLAAVVEIRTRVCNSSRRVAISFRSGKENGEGGAFA